jgi:hypothetical protein
MQLKQFVGLKGNRLKKAALKAETKMETLAAGFEKQKVVALPIHSKR